ncbi:UNVERIFIED_CONTAM: hypothetical protein RMT77_015540 [Armadillidium vulgare]
MPPKRKDPICGEKPVAELQADHELFLQAFEKPTQIYRYLRTRNLISPIFLQRTLYYMKGRMSRTHKNRANFKVDSLLGKLKQKNENGSKLPGTFLNIIFNGFYDKKLTGLSGEIAKIETFVVKICHKKRKESSSPLTQISVGVKDVLINPSENDKCNSGNSVKDSYKSSSMLSIPTYHFTANNGHQVKSFVLVFRVTFVHDQENTDEPQPKRRRVSRNCSQESSHSDTSTASGHNNNTSIPNNNVVVNGESTNGPLNGGTGTIGTNTNNSSNQKTALHTNCFGAELIVYDRYSRCQLCPGQYELVAYSIGPDAPAPGKTSPKKNVIWESLDTIKVEKLDEPLSTLENSPLIKFGLSWTEDNASNSNSNSHNISSSLKPKLRPLQPLDLVLTNNTATKPKPQGVASPEAPQLVLYQFVYNNNSRQQTEARYDFHCPWCSLKCCALYSLLKHLKLCHARFSFTYVPHPKGARIDVSLNECYDGSYAGNPQDLVVTPSGCSFSRSGPTRRSPTTSVLVCLPKRPKPSLSEFLEQDDNDFELPRSYILGHNRLYHHTMTCLPVQPHELDEDSEGEHDSEWVRTKTRMMIDEFSDVNEGEKELMKMWNLHVMKHNFVGDCQLPLACYMFIESHGSDLLLKNLYKNFVLHMASLNDFGLVGAGVVYKCLTMLQTKLEEEKVRSIVLSHWERQKRLSKRPFQSQPATPTPKSTLKSVKLASKTAVLNGDGSQDISSSSSNLAKTMLTAKVDLSKVVISKSKH